MKEILGAAVLGWAVGYAIIRMIQAMAPEGWEGEHGWHSGRQPLPDDEHPEEWAEREHPR